MFYFFNYHQKETFIVRFTLWCSRTWCVIICNSRIPVSLNTKMPLIWWKRSGSTYISMMWLMTSYMNGTIVLIKQEWYNLVDTFRDHFKSMHPHPLCSGGKFTHILQVKTKPAKRWHTHTASGEVFRGPNSSWSPHFPPRIQWKQQNMIYFSRVLKCSKIA